MSASYDVTRSALSTVANRVEERDIWSETVTHRKNITFYGLTPKRLAKGVQVRRFSSHTNGIGCACVIGLHV